MTFSQLLIAVLCYLKMLPMREGSESLFCSNKHDFVEKLFLVLIVYVDTNSTRY